jgi:2',3'-cyclic-nucleotide 2'-phosphodiesterase (5'-nucleotidase family)
MDNLLLRAIRKVAETDLAFSNGWRYGAPILPGPVEVNDLWNIVPTDPPISVCRITGEALWGMMEENLEHTFSRNPYMQMGGYVKRCLGLNIYFKIESPRGKRIQEFFVGGSRLKKDRSYSACFLTNQGIPKKYGEEKEDLDVGAIEALELFMNEESPVKSKYRGDIVPI